MATELARQGWAVCINYREREDCARSLVEQLTGEGCRVMAVQADVACREQVNTMVRQVEDAFGPVALLVNNAGVAGQALFQDITDELWHRYFSVNVDGAYHAIQAVLPAMLHHHEGCIINTSSIWGLRGASCEVTYSCTKAALIGLTRSLAAELAPTHIRVELAWRRASSARICWTPCPPRYCPSWRRRLPWAAWERRRTSPTPWRFWPRTRRTSSPGRC